MAHGLLTIDCGAVVRNWRRLCEIHAGGAVAAVVKANAYGLGAAPIATALRDAGCRHFFVATVDEGEALRKVLDDGPMIAVLDGFRAGRHPRLTPVLNSLEQIEAHAGQVILHVDSGMSRLGLPVDELEALARDPGRLAHLETLFVMTHLAAAEDVRHPLNAAQLARFNEACLRLPRARRSIANSSGIFLGPRFASELARPGAALYGINPTPGRPNPMEPVFTLAGQVLQLRDIPAGQTVGYGGAWLATRPSRIATLGLGYADGIPRAVEGKLQGRYRGQSFPMVGRVSMDLMTFDVTDLPGLRPGRWVELIHSGQDVDAVAEMAGTIGYEILTSLGRRYRREYLPA
ncbi:alanine racemase [Sediminicoccus sp. KRV36]|uniref:alanine racemase n=1 Tax=Sediminicoccus sp. KRV36 TaxID=3133721 RepID=UPI00200E97A1|nr:alanine racemase [Sediminicoccus rosea]UPY37504.1 alanine racemase [Sediminicoccus rosea]